jgi:catechol 2,3-dioxygenase-like lactoylglutathione lyase family enzyme
MPTEVVPTTAELTLAHVGIATADLDAAMADYARLGVQAWDVWDVMDRWAFDFTTMRTVHQRNRLAFGTAPGLGTVELVVPDPTLPVGPTMRLFQARAGLNHLAYTCADLVRSASEMLDAGGRLYTFTKPRDDEEHWLELLEAGGERMVLPELTSCLIQLSSGSIVELLQANP